MGLKDNIISFRKDISKHFQADLAKERNVLGRKIGEARKKEEQPNACSSFFWRRHPDLNRGSGICSPVPYHLAMAPYMGFADGSVRKSFFAPANDQGVTKSVTKN